MKYKLFDLEITTKGDPKTYNCSHEPEEGLIISGENFRFKKGTTSFSHYAFASLMPYIAAKQRALDKDDWMYFESEIACPDPQCGARFALKRVRRKTYEYNVRN